MDGALDLARALDRVEFARSLELEPDPWQAEFLRSEDKQVLLNCSRQSGKSTTSAILALHEALYHPGALVLMLSPSLRQSGELFKKALSFYRQLGKPVPSESETALSLSLASGSRIVSLPGTEGKIRGFSGVSLLVVDEASRVEDSLYYSTRPMLAVSGGRLMLLSTPWGRRGAFFKEWSEGGEGWRRFRVTAEQCPRISPEFLENERKTLGAWWFDQEYGCEFRETTDSVFSHDVIEAAMSDEVEPLFGEPKAAPSEPVEGEVSPLFGGGY